MLEIGRFLQKRRSFKWTVTRVDGHIHIYLNSILVIIIWISAKCIFDKWFVLVIEFIWSDNNSVYRVVFFVNGRADLIRIGDSRAKCILKFFAVPFLNWDERTVKWLSGLLTSSETIIMTVFRCWPSNARLNLLVKLSIAKSWRQRNNWPLPSNASNWVASRALGRAVGAISIL